MALRDQPYLPLYIQDFLTDEKLIECSASATGVYIRLLCILHKSEDYGKILLKQKDKQVSNQIENFASKIAKQMPYPIDVVLSGLTELVTENVIQVEGDLLIQKRMVKDNSVSVSRAKAGKDGGIKTQKKIKEFAKANVKANAENENENENENRISNNVELKGVENFFYIGTEVYKLAASKFLQDHKSVTLEAWQMQNKEFTIQQVFLEMDKECVGKSFGDEEHIFNMFKLIYKSMVKEKNKPKSKFVPAETPKRLNYVIGQNNNKPLKE